MQRHEHTSIDWGQCIVEAARYFRGDPNSHLSSPERGKLCWGNKGSLVIWIYPSPKGGHFADYEADRKGGVLDFLRVEAGMEKADAVRWLRERGLIPIPPGRDPAFSRPASRRPPQSNSAAARDDDRVAKARGLWQRSMPIPKTAEHPARLWLGDRNLWRPGFPLPDAVRWLPPGPRHLGAGSLIAVLAPVSAWADAWPDVPTPTAVHTVAVDARGRPSLDWPAQDGGRPKRSRGNVRGTVLLIGNPYISEARTPVRVCEGLADTLALAIRFEGPVLAALGTPARLARDKVLVKSLAAAPYGIVIHADADGEGGPGPRAAAALRLAVTIAGGTARAVTVRDGKDAADQARQMPFEDLHEAWQDYARTLEEMHPTWPRWEIARVSAIISGRTGL